MVSFGETGFTPSTLTTVPGRQRTPPATLTDVTALEYLIAKIPTGATVAVLIAFASTLMTREMPLDLLDILFFLGVWLAGTIAAAVLLAVFEMLRDRWL